MNEYLKAHIHEEIEGALDYMSKAVELKASNPEVAAKFFKMAEMEAEHANCLTKIFNSMNKDADVSDADYSAMQKSIISLYANSMGKYEGMKKMYYSN